MKFINRDLSHVFVFCVALASAAGACVPEKSKSADGPIRLVIDITGNVAGTVEPCGCVKGQLGGLARRATAIQDARSKIGDGYIYLDYGNLLYPAEPSNGFDMSQRRLRARTLAQDTGRMKPDAYNLTIDDLEDNVEETVTMLRAAGLPLVSANLRDRQGRPLAPASMSLKRNGIRIAVTGISEPADGQSVLPDGLRVLPVKDVLKDVIPALKETHDIVIVLSHSGSLLQSYIADTFGPVIVLGARYDTAGVPVTLPRGSAGAGATTLGRHIGRLVLDYSRESPAFFNATPQKPQANAPTDTTADHAKTVLPASPQGTSPYRLFLLPIDARIAENPEARRDIDRMKQAMVEQATTDYGSSAAQAVADERPVYAGSQTCQKCHQIQYEYWANHPHAHAMETLRKTNNQNDATCIGCHSLGFNETSGYRGTVVPKFFENVQCESCHTAAVRHISDVLSYKPSRTVPKETCLKCHGAFHEEKPFSYEKMIPLASCPSATPAEPVTPSPDQEPGTGESPAKAGPAQRKRH